MDWRRFRKLMKKSWYRRRVLGLSLFWALLILTASLALALLFGKTADAQSDDATVYYKYFRNVRIERGDTLWDYAGLYKSPDGQSRSAYIDEVKQINHLKSDALVEGKTIVLPYYSTEYICSDKGCR